MRIILDAMGGDSAPEEIIKGAVLAAGEFDVDITLVGNRQKIEDAAAECRLDISRFAVVHTDVEVGMEDDPLSVRREKKDSSMCVGLRLLAAGEGDAFVSAGNTGALFTASSLIVRKIRGIHRAAIASIIPVTPPVLLIDAGANVTVTSAYLEHFAIMGGVYMRCVMGTQNPRVGLLNNGAEPGKGTALQIEAYQVLSKNKNINFVGNIEANKVGFDCCDVLVTDGYTGNILLKSIEGMGKLFNDNLKGCFSAGAISRFAGYLVKGRLREFKTRFDASTYGGAPFLGLNRPVIKAHGSSNARAIKNAVGQAIGYSKTGVSQEIAGEISRIISEDGKAISEEGSGSAANVPKV
ncbi:MAG: phosphate acyltransferase PlsX [Eubacteriales bacterium]|jgi:glycerol-3-phosphate acyltransferase PlsX